MEAPITNRRRAPRAKVSLPIRIRCFEPNWPEEIGKTSNVSREGFYFETTARHFLDQYFHNWKVRVIRNFQPGDVANVEEAGQIVRIDRLPEGKLGVAVQILARLEPEIIAVPKRFSPKK
jgi:hypothetical protein